MDKVRIGMIGSGAIAQVQHMPNLHELQDLFEVTWTCDVSAKVAAYLADRFNVPNHTTDFRKVLEAEDVDAVILCHADPKTEIAVASFDAGKHAFVEKPMCFSKDNAKSIAEAVARSGKVGQVGYMKVYDPAFLITEEESRGWEPTFVQVNHLHPNNDLHTSQFHVERFDDIPASVGEIAGAARAAELQQALGKDIPKEAVSAFFTLAGSMIHDLYGLRILFGNPKRIISTDVWNDGRALSTVLEYPNGSRCIASWIDLPNLWDFKETLEIYGADKRIILAYPTGFSRGQLSELSIWEIDGSGRTIERKPAVEWQSPFVGELRHFHECITKSVPCRTSVADAYNDITLVINSTQAYLNGSPIDFG